MGSRTKLLYRMVLEESKIYMDKICETCWNQDCKNRGEEFMKEKLPVCKDMIEHPEHWECEETEQEWY